MDTDRALKPSNEPSQAATLYRIQFIFSSTSIPVQGVLHASVSVSVAVAAVVAVSVSVFKAF